ncbi:aminotransferase class V-fold PLP-dependent enzyme [Anaeroselena agilis]|uniref:cysteine desulfurase n=1 Tax=Anaeroselena agilis TaxID=3063788 RepID=A0ABU3P2T5_9FIRM|nr:aminotransferase class V-fold PLP-dependent enzyme [Selenomonadales bacterium 4137-cl]
MIYLDNAATSWPKPAAVPRAVAACLRRAASPGRGGHGLSREADKIMFAAREELSALFAATNSSTITFTANATDAVNTALFGLLAPGDRVVTTSMEHNAVARPLRALENRGLILDIVPCDHTGALPLDNLRSALKGGAKAVVATHASNVTGTIMPLADIGRLAHDAGALLIVDAAQTAGVEPIDVAAMGIDAMAFSGHKSLLGPQGTGGLYVREGIMVEPFRHGGTGSLSESDRQPLFYPDRLESGTPNTPGIAGLLAGVRYINKRGLENIRIAEYQLTADLLAGLTQIPGIAVYGPPAGEPRTAVVSFTVGDQDSGEIAHRLDREFGIACRGGLHCAPWAHQTIGSLVTGTVRFSPGCFTAAADIAAALAAVADFAGAN